MFGVGDELLGLTYRRLKWHMAEHNRIAAFRGQLLQQGLVREVELGLLGHRFAAEECAAMLRFEEPRWEGERSITEGYLDWDAHNPTQSYEDWKREFSQDHNRSVQEQVAQEPAQS